MEDTIWKYKNTANTENHIWHNLGVESVIVIALFNI